MLPSLETVIRKLSKDFVKMSENFGQMSKVVSSMQSDLLVVKKDLAGVKEELDTVAMHVVSMDQYMHEKLATKDELAEVEVRLTGHIEGLATQQKTFDQELTSHQSRTERLEERVTKLEGSPA